MVGCLSAAAACRNMSVHAQQKPDSLREFDDGAAQERIHEDLLGISSESSDETQLSELMEFFRLHPVDLNRASRLELEGLPGLGPVLAKSIIDYRQSKPIERLSDLKNVSGMTDDTFLLIRDMVSTGNERPSRTSFEIRQRVVRALDAPVGEYRGNLYQVYHRVEMCHRPDREDPTRELTAGTVLEKDAGETRWNDHHVFYVEARNFSFIKHATAGHYQLEFGQGLVLWGGRGSVKGSEVTQTVKKSGRGMHRFSYASESGALFGGAFGLNLGGTAWFRNIEPTFFFSRTNLDASSNADGTIRALQLDGLHRDSAELAKEGALDETIWGTNLDFRLGSSLIGLTLYENRFDRTFALSDTARDRYHFTGRRNRVTGAHYDVFVFGVNLFGELAVDKNGHRAFNSGIRWGNGQAEGALMYRHYSKSFQNLHGSGFGEQSGSRNEEGIYLGAGYRLRQGTRIRAYYDIFRTPWRTYEVPRRVYGDDLLVQWDERLSAEIQVTARFKNERKDVSISATDIYGRDTPLVGRAETQRARLQMDWDVLPKVRLRSRAEGVRYRVPGPVSQKEDGSSLYQDIRWCASRRITLYTRWTLFDTDGSSSAIYEYENDIDGIVTNSLFMDRGTRWYVAVRMKWSGYLTILAKYWERYREIPDSTSEITRRFAMSITYGF